MKSDRELEDAKIGYERALHLVDLVSREIHSINSIMMAANSIFLSAIGLGLRKDAGLPEIIIIMFIISGIFLCILWKSYINHYIDNQSRFREEAKRIEKEYFQWTFKLLTGSRNISNLKEIKDPSYFASFSRYIIYLFVLLYLLFLFYLIDWQAFLIDAHVVFIEHIEKALLK